MIENIFNGIITALITPLYKQEIDIPTLQSLVKKQIDSGIKAILVGGSTGEGSSLTEHQHIDLIKIVSEYAKNKIKIIGSITAPSTQYAIKKLEYLETINIDGIMCTTPHYVTPEQEGIYQHFKAINDYAPDLPLILYLHPTRTGCKILDSTISKIMQLSKFVAIKDASSDITKPLSLLPKHTIGILSGNDISILPYYANGASGCISVTANIFPKAILAIDNAWKNGNFKKALSIQKKLYPLYKAIFSEANPIGIKYAMSQLKLCSSEILLPLTKPSTTTQNNINYQLKQLQDFESDV